MQAVGQIFRISKYEAYIVFSGIRVEDKNAIDFRAFLDCLNGQIQKLRVNEAAKEKETNVVE